MVSEIIWSSTQTFDKPMPGQGRKRSRYVLVSNGEVTSIGNTVNRRGVLRWETLLNNMDVKFWAEFPLMPKAGAA